MKKLAVAQLINFDVEIRFVEHSDGGYTRIENEEEAESSFEESKTGIWRVCQRNCKEDKREQGNKKGLRDQPFCFKYSYFGITV